MFIKEEFTKWHPLYSYGDNCNSYLVQCRKNLKTGYLHFDTNKVSENSHHVSLGLDPTEQFKKVVEDNNNFYENN